jgi:hypothetical protein
MGMNFNIHSGSDLDATGTGVGFVIGADAYLGFSPNLGMISRLSFYDNRSGSRTKDGTQGGVNYTVETSASVAYFQFEELFLFKLPQIGIFFFGGPGFGINVEGSGEATTKITSPGVTFQDGSTSQKAKSTIKDMLVRFELKFGGGYEIPLSRSMVLAPQLSFGLGLTKVVSDVSWRIMTIQVIVPLKFAII